MTAYGGARARPAVLAPRRRVSAPVRAGRRSHPVGALIAGVVIAFVLGLLYLAQTIQLAGAQYELDRLLAERDDLLRQVQTVETTIVRWGSEPLVLERAQQLRFDPLGTRTRLPAR